MHMEIHISGPSGSGKSFLGERLKHEGFFVVDMDDFFQPGDGRWEKLIACGDDFDLRSTLWHEMKNERFVHFRKQANGSMIIWIGLTDHAASPNEPFYDMHVEHKFFIEISDVDLCRQYYTRLLTQKAEDVDWLHIPSSNDVIATSNMLATHIKHDYLVKRADTIFSFVTLLK